MGHLILKGMKPDKKFPRTQKMHQEKKYSKCIFDHLKGQNFHDHKKNFGPELRLVCFGGVTLSANFWKKFPRALNWDGTHWWIQGVPEKASQI